MLTYSVTDCWETYMIYVHTDELTDRVTKVEEYWSCICYLLYATKNALLDIIEYYVRSHQSKPHGKLKKNHEQLL